MNKKLLTEADIRTKFITPALVGANGDKWNLMTQIREEAYFTKGRVIVRGKMVMRGEAKKARKSASKSPPTIAQIAGWHNTGTKNMPQRLILAAPDAATSKAVGNDLVRAILAVGNRASRTKGGRL